MEDDGCLDEGCLDEGCLEEDGCFNDYCFYLAVSTLLSVFLTDYYLNDSSFLTPSVPCLFSNPSN